MGCTQAKAATGVDSAELASTSNTTARTTSTNLSAVSSGTPRVVGRRIRRSKTPRSDASTAKPESTASTIRDDTSIFLQTLSAYFDCRKQLKAEADRIDAKGKLRTLRVSANVRQYVHKRHKSSANTSGSLSISRQQHDIQGQPVKNVQDLLDAAAFATPHFKRFLNKLVDGVEDVRRSQVLIAPAKQAARINEKAVNDYSEREPGPAESWVYDVTRASLICTSARQMRRVAKWLHQNSQIVVAKNRFKNPTISGYRDILFVVKIYVPAKDKLHSYFDHMCELQIHHKRIWGLNHKLESHKHYEFFRAYFRGNDEESVGKRLEDLEAINAKGRLDESVLEQVLESYDGWRMRRLARLFYEHLPEYELALMLLYQARDLAIIEDGDDHIHVAAIQNNIGYVLGQRKEDYDVALEHYLLALRIIERHGGIVHPETASAYSNIGNTLNQRGRGEYLSAFLHHERALIIRRHVLGKKHADTASSYASIGNVLHSVNNLKGSMKNHRLALKIRLSVLGRRHPCTASSFHSIGTLLHSQKKTQDALDHHQQALEIRIEVLGQRHPETASSYYNIGELFLLLQTDNEHESLANQNKALDFHKLALEIRQAVLGNDHPYTQESILSVETLQARHSQFAHEQAQLA
jgi:tetratricopeptide (TPR) repeat protein